MSKIQTMATAHPLLFAVLVVLVFIVFMVVSSMIGMAVPGEAGVHIGQTLGRVGTTACFIYMLWRFGWLTTAGFTRFKGWPVWIPVLIPMVYVMLVGVYTYTGDLRFSIQKPALASAVVLNMLSIGLVEETVFRGVIFHGFMRAWSSRAQGIVTSVLVSAVLFGGIHMIWAAMGKPVHLAALQSFSAFLAGIYYAAFVLHSRSIWPVVLFHGAVNAAVNVKILGDPEFAETTSAGFLFILLIVPVVVLGLVLVWKNRDKEIIVSSIKEEGSSEEHPGE